MVVEQPQFKVEQQRVELLPGARAETLEPVTLLLNQPAGMDSEDARASMNMGSLSEAHREGVRALHGHFARQACVAPLERGANGLQVFTQDWRVSRKIEADLRRLEQEFIIEVRGETTPRRWNAWRVGPCAMTASCPRPRPAGRTRHTCAWC